MYLTIGYKESKEDYCRGCHMGTFDEESRIERFETALEVAKFIASVEAHDKHGRHRSWNWTIVTANDINDPEKSFYGGLDSDTIPSEVSFILDEERRLKLAEVENDKKNKRITEQRKQELQIRLDQENRDKIEFERLKTKFGKG